MVDTDDFGEEFGLNVADLGGVFGSQAFLSEEVLIEDLVEEGAFAGTGDTAETDESLLRNMQVEVADVMLRGSVDREARSVMSRAPCLRDFDVFATGEEATGQGVGGEELFVGAGEAELSAFDARLGPDFYKVLGGPHDGFVVLDNNDGISLIGESAKDSYQAVKVADGVRRRVHRGRRGYPRGGTKAGGQVDTHGFSAAESA